MTIRYDIDFHDHTIFIAAFGVISVSDIATTLKEIESQIDASIPINMVIELREIKRAFVVREMDRLVKILSDGAGGYVDYFAFVVSRDTMMGVGRRFARRAYRKGLKLKVFNDYADATKWLTLNK